jgi:hypothetical protein
VPVPLPRGDLGRPPGREGVEERVGRGVVGLARVPGRRQRGETDEELQPRARGRLVEVDQARDLRGEDRPQVGRGLLGQVAVAQDPGAVQDPVERAVSGHDAGDAALDRGAVRDVQLPVARVRPGRAQLVEQRGRLFGRTAAQHQHRRGDTGGDLPGEHPAEAARAPGDQVDAAGPPRPHRGRAGQRAPPRDLAAAVRFPRHHVVGGDGFPAQTGGHLGRVGGGRHLDELGEQLRVLAARGAHQPGQPGVRLVLRTGGHDDLQQHPAVPARPDGLLQPGEQLFGLRGEGGGQVLARRQGGAGHAEVRPDRGGIEGPDPGEQHLVAGRRLRLWRP